MKNKYYIVGSGIVGSVIARELAERGAEVVVWERRNHIGGNIYDFTGKEVVEKEIETLGSLSLSFFLTMALMGLKLWQLFDLALPLMVMLIAQVLLVGLFAYIVTYRVMGKNYEAVVFASATCGFGMGATPNAIANMDELTNRYGFVHTPYFVVPIVGCLFIDFINSAIITMFINFIS